MVTAPPRAATEADEYQKVCDIVNNGVKDLLVQILDKLKDPSTFREEVRYLADRQGVPREAVDDTDRMFASFWNHCTGLQGDLKWLNSSAVPERSRSFVKDFTPAADVPETERDATIRWGISLPFGIGFHT
ncbi:hypothetical protein ACFWU3_06880 [Streptomyces sp. NPDC058685]|uniref:hypothetical protein n=1 Tax=Streptomyces sp. NPDC058685 TaxID=3346598 RepID=UPI0036632F3A